MGWTGEPRRLDLGDDCAAERNIRPYGTTGPVVAARPLVAVACLTTAACGAGHQPTRPQPQIPSAVLRQTRPVGRAPRFHPPLRGPVVGVCQRRLGLRYGAHVELFGANRVVILSRGIGTRPPRRVAAGRISTAGCFGGLVTLEPTGLVLVRPGRPLTVADLFRAWGQPLSRRRMAGFLAPAGASIRVYVNGKLRRGPPGAVVLRRHAEIVLEAGPYVPPHRSYTFPPGT
jgi:hypothetical protein